ncbi:hypothetical protein [Gilvimarinus algae]|uniref:Uncharacterized protein n=1 Tax=Gilvimarinus algae TaxID=3058037 RepID=A0ABT8TE36_9GAMM|nr:hypothetical protein [Gilvimarinus sp. SDUM040014]MDO3382381.1 hypothetical protein [Gilvimarinus sp. SDUM040014]
MTRVICLFVLAFISCFTLAAGTSGDVKISGVQVVTIGEHNYIAVKPEDGSFLNPDLCQDSLRAVIPLTDIAKDQKLSLLIAGLMANQTVNLKFDGCMITNINNVEMPVISSVSLKK